MEADVINSEGILKYVYSSEDIVNVDSKKLYDILKGSLYPNFLVSFSQIENESKEIMYELVYKATAAYTPFMYFIENGVCDFIDISNSLLTFIFEEKSEYEDIDCKHLFTDGKEIICVSTPVKNKKSDKRKILSDYFEKASKLNSENSKLFSMISEKLKEKNLTYDEIVKALNNPVQEKCERPEKEFQLADSGDKAESNTEKMICRSCGATFENGVFCIYCGSKLETYENSSLHETQHELVFETKDEYNDNNYDETTVIGFEETTLLDSKALLQYTPNLLHVTTKEKFYITKRSFVIGKSFSRADYIIQNNVAVSRVHAIINTVEDRYYIVDQGSTNGTYVNGARIPPQQNVQIKEGDNIKLANEEFVFSLK